MSDNDFDNSELAKWDPTFIERVGKVLAPVAKVWFRAEVRSWSPCRPLAARCWSATTPAGP